MAARHAARFTDRFPAIPQHSRMRIFPADRKRFVDLDILTSLDAAATKDALIWIVAVKWVRVVHFVRFRLERNLLMLDGHQLGRVVHRTIPVVIVADGAVKHVVAQNTVEGFPLSGDRSCGSRGNVHSGCDVGGAGPDQLAVHLHHARVAGLNRTELRMVANLGNFRTDTIDELNERLIELINRIGSKVPQVCYHPQLGPIQTCDTCMVEVDGKLVRACATPVAPGMNVSTTSARAVAAQREAFDRILGNHMLYCTVCDNNNGNCTVHNTTKLLAVEHQKIPFKTKPYEVDNSNPFYRYDPDQCILCGRCVEACQNVEVNETLSIRWEDPHPRVLWDGGKPIGESSCVSCGHCITVCPCNALMEKSMLGHAGFFTKLPKPALDGMIDMVKGIEPDTGYEAILKLSEAEAAMRESRIRRTKTVCTYCGVGCSFDIWTKDRHILKVEPSEGAANGISTCVKGKFAWDFVNSADRLTKPLIREGDKFREASWDEALDLIARRFSEIKARTGPDSLAFISSSKCTNEESYLMQKLARAVIGTNNMDNCSRYCQSPATVGLWRTVGYGGDSGSIKDIENAGLVLIIGSNTAESHPVLATRVKRAHKLHGQKLIVSDLREHEMARRADLFLRPKPGTDLVWLSAVSRYILDNGLAKTSFLDQWVNGLDEYKKSLAPFTMEFASRVCGISVDILEKVAHMIAEANGVCILWAMGITQHSMGSDSSTAISNLLLVTGNYMRTGTGAYPLRGHNNVQGASDHGAMPNFLPGYQSVDDPEVRSRFKAAWNVQMPSTKGLDNHEMIDAIHQGKLKAMYLFGEEM